MSILSCFFIYYTFIIIICIFIKNINIQHNIKTSMFIIIIILCIFMFKSISNILIENMNMEYSIKTSIFIIIHLSYYRFIVKNQH